jgi:BirA family biotin operon repressor/biotin-[acetyl-CoA-carboxylase] ligase
MPLNPHNCDPDSGSSALHEAPPLSRSGIERRLTDAALPESVVVEVVPATGSTNEDLLVRCRQSQPDATLLRATDQQSAGRGRQRRSWLARPRSALLFSLAVPLRSLPANLPAVTLACGVALAEQLIARGVPVRLKWPNDLLLAGRKLAGVLCELAVDADGRATLVIGIGVNGWLTDDDRLRIGQPAASLTEAVPPRLLADQRETWIGALAVVALRAVRRFAGEGFLPWQVRYNELLAARGELVDIIDDGQIIASGRLGDVDALGRLMLTGPQGSRAISVGDVSLRLASAQGAS